MKYLVIFVAVIATASAALTESQKDNIKAVAQKCIETSGVDKDILAAARAGNYKDDAKFKKFVLCVFSKLQFLDENGTIIISEEKSKSWMPDQLTDAEKNHVISTCNGKTGANAEDTAFAIYKCYRENYPAGYSSLI